LAARAALVRLLCPARALAGGGMRACAGVCGRRGAAWERL